MSTKDWQLYSKSYSPLLRKLLKDSSFIACWGCCLQRKPYIQNILQMHVQCLECSTTYCKDCWCTDEVLKVLRNPKVVKCGGCRSESSVQFQHYSQILQTQLKDSILTACWGCYEKQTSYIDYKTENHVECQDCATVYCKDCWTLEEIAEVCQATKCSACSVWPVEKLVDCDSESFELEAFLDITF